MMIQALIYKDNFLSIFSFYYIKLNDVCIPLMTQKK